MIGERLAEIRKDYQNTQSDLAKKLNVSLHTVRAWEQDKSSPSHDMLVRICNLYHISSDYLLGLSEQIANYPIPKDELTKEEKQELIKYKEYLIWKRKK